MNDAKTDRFLKRCGYGPRHVEDKSYAAASMIAAGPRVAFCGGIHEPAANDGTFRASVWCGLREYRAAQTVREGRMP